MSENLNATRMELLNIKNRIKLAKKGHKLLKQKRDFLVMEFLRLLDETKSIQKDIYEKIRVAYDSLSLAQSYHGIFELEAFSLSINEVLGVSVSEKNVMGIRIPIINKNVLTREISERGYSIIGSSAKMEQTADDFEKALDAIIDMAEAEISIRRLVTEIEKTKRRVNALEYSIIPELEKNKKDIEFRLDEMERDNFVTLKALKEVIGQENPI